jgi:hypothetical protein
VAEAAASSSSSSGFAWPWQQREQQQQLWQQCTIWQLVDGSSGGWLQQCVAPRAVK